MLLIAQTHSIQLKNSLFFLSLSVILQPSLKIPQLIKSERIAEDIGNVPDMFFVISQIDNI